MIEKMDCPSEATLTQLLQGGLAAGEARTVRAHVDGCPTCLKAMLAVPVTQASPAQRVGAVDASLANTRQHALAELPAGAIPPKPLNRGDPVGRYLVIETIGEGGMGVVYLAYDPELDRRVALKLLRDDAAPGTLGKSRLLREAQAMAKLSHPNVVAIHDVGTFGDRVFLAMELVEGSTLKEWMAEKPRTWREILEVFREAGQGLVAAHRAGLIHRDFKPANVLVGKDGRVLVTDFGLARPLELGQAMLDSARPEPSLPVSRISGGLLLTPLTQVGMVSGTPAYMAPEQAAAKALDARTDEFSFCVAAYEALYGARPFEGRPGSVGNTVVLDPPAATLVPPWVRRVLLRGLAMRPADRFGSVGDLLVALANDPGLRIRRIALAVGGAVAIFGLTLAGSWLVAHHGPDVCVSPERRLAGIWDEPTRQRVKAALSATGDPGAGSTWEFTERALDHAAEGWLEAWGQACKATRETHSESEAALQLRLQCLELQRLDLEATTGLLAHPDLSLSERATGAVASLRLPSECGDPRSLAVTDPTHRIAPQVAALRKRLALARALANTGKTGQARPELTTIIEAARKLSYPPLEADALVAMAEAQAEDADFPGQATSAGLAADVAEISHLDRLAARAVALGYDAASRLDRLPAELDELRERMRILVQRTGGNPVTTHELERSLCAASLRGGQADALVHCNRDVELSREAFGPNRPETLDAVERQGEALGAAARPDEALASFREAISMSDLLFGPNSRSVLPDWVRVTELLADLGRGAEAQAAATEVLALSHEYGEGPQTVAAFAIDAIVNGQEGKSTKAVRLADQAEALATRLGLWNRAARAEDLRFLVEARLAAGQAAQAVTLAQRLIALQETFLGPNRREWIPILKTAGAVHLAAGQPEAAVGVLERALALSTDQPVLPGWRAQIRFDLARALVATRGDRPRAAELSNDAREELSHLPAFKPLLSQVDAWRASNIH